MIRPLAFLFAIIAAGPAAALSCAVPTVAGAYTAAAQSPAAYVIAVGSLRLTGPSNPPQGAVAQGGDINRMVGYTQPARFEGEFFTGSDFDASRDVPMTVDVTCVAAWCGAARDVSDALFFFRVVNGGYVLTENACPGFVFDQAHPGMLEEVINCHQGTCPGAW
ncbi:hypothetical protein A8B78_01125 [Jannaschia sp. EhC01]|nr:hypothetical protein A8B78_01125 [Jannaschia sp. EhC01]